MFDQTPTNQNNAAGKSTPPPNLPQVDVVTHAPQPPKPAEDMFAQTEPASIRASQPMRPPVAPSINQADLYGGRSVWDNRAMVIALLIVGLAVVGAVVWGAVIVLNPKKPAVNVNANAVANTEVNTDNVANANNETVNENINANVNENVNANANTNEEPVATDSDYDGLSDTEEARLGTDPQKFDTDSDGLLDRIEVYIYKTDPLQKDTDSDGYNDGDEVINGFDPTKGGGARILVVPQQ